MFVVQKLIEEHADLPCSGLLRRKGLGDGPDAFAKGMKLHRGFFGREPTGGLPQWECRNGRCECRNASAALAAKRIMDHDGSIYQYAWDDIDHGRLR